MLRASEVPDAWGVNVLVYGHFGSGKTYFGGTAADDARSRDVLVVDAEGGTRTLADRSDVVVVKPDRFRDVIDLLQWLREEKHSYRTVVIDSITEVQALGMKDIMLSAKDPSFPGLQDYGRSNEQITRLVRRFRDLAHARGINVVFTALAREDKDEVSGVLVTRPALTPKAAEGICGSVDTVAFIERDAKSEKRTLRLGGNSRILAKHRHPHNAVEVPDFLEPPTFAALLDLVAQGGGGVK